MRRQNRRRRPVRSRFRHCDDGSPNPGLPRSRRRKLGWRINSGNSDGRSAYPSAVSFRAHGRRFCKFGGPVEGCVAQHGQIVA